MTEPNEGLSNRTPSLQISWDSAKPGITGTEVSKIVLDTEPRIVLASANTGSVSIVPYQMSPGDDKVVAERLYALLSKPPKMPAPAARDVEREMTSGMAKPRACGQAITNTVTVRSMAAF